MVDDILLKKNLLDYAGVLEPSASWLVAVKCDLDIVREREAKDPADSQAQQTPTSTQFMNMVLIMTSKSNTSRASASAPIWPRIIEGWR